ncbi:MAG: GNAT family N-acetyltransferase [Candidatus Hydrogenedens sp.]|nr:GNAT family N-acetyltransferase [Candidatus Hydrogenedens sp.]
MMLHENLEIRGAKTQYEINEAIQLMASISRQDFFVANDWLINIGAKYPNFLNEHIRIALYNGKVISALRITTDIIRIGEARLKIGGIGWVSTDGHFRNKGIASKVIQNAVQYMKVNSYHLSMLFGIPNFYHRFGFATTLPEYYASITTREVLSIQPIPHKVRKMKPSDISSIRKIHDENDEDIACSLIRTQAHFAVKWREWEQGKTVLDLNGKILGYFLLRINHDNILLVQEIGSIDVEASKAVLYAIGKLAEKERLGIIQIASPPCHPTTRLLINHYSVHETHYKRNEGGMMAIINEEETLECMIPEWEKRIQQKTFIHQDDEVTLLILGVPYCIHFRKGSISIIKKSGKNKVSMDKGEFVQLLAGYTYISDILERKRFSISTDARNFLFTIFPKRFPYVWQMDRF